MSTGLSETGNHIWIVLEGMLQVARTAKRFATAQQQLVQRVARKKGKSRGETKRSKTNWISCFSVFDITSCVMEHHATFHMLRLPAAAMTRLTQRASTPRLCLKTSHTCFTRA